MASPNISEQVVMAIKNRQRKLADNVTNNNALLKRMQSKGKIDFVDGGHSIIQELEYDENSTFKRYSGYEMLDVSPSDFATAAEFDWKQCAVSITASGLDEIRNGGSSRMINHMKAKHKNAERTLMNQISKDIYSDGMADGGKQIGGLQLLVSDLPTDGRVGGIDRSEWAFWQNYAVNATNSGGNVTSANIQSYMNKCYVGQSRGNDTPDLIVADNNFWIAYLESLQAMQRITGSTDLASAGFNTLKYMNADVVLDGGIGNNCPQDHMYFLNCDYLHWRPHKDRNFSSIGDTRVPTNQDAKVAMIGWAGNMTLSNASLQGVLFNA